MVKFNKLFQNAKSRLVKNGVENAYFDAKELFSHVFGKEPVYFDMNAFADEEKQNAFESLINRRIGDCAVNRFSTF